MAKYIDVDKLIADIERRIDSWSTREKNSPVGQGKDTCVSRVTELTDLLSFIRSLQQEQSSLPVNLDEAEVEYAQSLNENPANQEEDKMIYDAFKAGAEWMAKQGVTVNGYITDEIAYNGVAVILDSEENFKPEEEVVVQIRKK